MTTSDWIAVATGSVALIGTAAQYFWSQQQFKQVRMHRRYDVAILGPYNSMTEKLEEVRSTVDIAKSASNSINRRLFYQQARSLHRSIEDFTTNAGDEDSRWLEIDYSNIEKMTEDLSSEFDEPLLGVSLDAYEKDLERFAKKCRDLMRLMRQ